ncbi:hypothetical protein BSL78_27628 [Apostichopus japonicus]|uniref:Integrase catalytic domain-containing protein n=1 Tax=Stichopus japonicus TaxID=307972 RepID=A0A2G8JIG6_STIJA|nr:hypothetical protein BSL78_27628 [Apostichopus japonicus]
MRGTAKHLNPIGPDGYPLKCSSCESIRHLLKDCPDSYENMQKRVFKADVKDEEAVLFTGNKQIETEVLMNEAVGAAILDSALLVLLTCYLDMLDEEKQARVMRIDDVVSKCEVCKQYKKTPSRPVVGLPLAKEFNEVVALDLKEWKSGIYFLHIIDVATRFSVAGVIRHKTPKVIIEKVMKLWIGSGMGAPKKFLSDNGGEFANEEFRDMAENLNIEIWNTAGYSPWQNGLCERNHAVVDNCVEKILEDYPTWI